MGLIPQSFIDDLMSRVDVVEVVEEYVPLKKKGKDWMACCPFHNEKTPSFSVSREKQFYYCFGCGAHGTALGFLMDHARMDFRDAVENLAERAGVEVPEEAGDGGRGPSLAPLYETLEQAAAWYQRQLREHAQAGRAVDYLRGRGLSGEVAARFGLGFAPPGWDNLLQALGPDEAARDRLAQTGLTITRDDGRTYDRFRDRVMFPIHDRRGRVVAFGGRVLDDSTPKYLNSPETPVFHKGRELYGLHQAQTARGARERLLVVEGYMDVVALAQHGIEGALATLGTAATSDHLQRLFRTVPEVVFCFDGDRAGRTAAWRALETALPHMREGHQARFMFLPEGEDPDSLVRTEGREAFEARMSEAVSLSTYLFDQLTQQVDMSTLDGRSRLVELARPLVGRLPPGAFRQLVLGRLGELAGMDTAAVTDALEGRAARTPPRERPARRGTPPSGRPSLVRQTITLLLHHPSLAGHAAGLERVATLDRPGVPLLVELLELLHARPNLTTAGALQHFQGRDEGRHLAKLAAGERHELTDALETEFTDAWARLNHLVVEQRYAALTEKARAGGLDDAEKREYAAVVKALAAVVDGNDPGNGG